MVVDIIIDLGSSSWLYIDAAVVGIKLENIENTAFNLVFKRPGVAGAVLQSASFNLTPTNIRQ